MSNPSDGRGSGAALSRRGFLLGSAGAAAAAALGCGPGSEPPPDDGWDAGEVLHVLPTASHHRIRLKASFREPLAEAPRLRVGERIVPGVGSDTAGRFWSFDVDGLAPATRHRLQLERADGSPLCEDWPLATFPAPDARPGRFRLLAYTCAGGPDHLYNFTGFHAFLPNALRQRLLARALAFAPDAVVANGDHVYWDLLSRAGRFMGRSPRAWWVAGLFDRSLPVLGTPNEEVLLRAFGPQLADLYGVRFRSLPGFFLQDDHDYGENDEASEALRTFPPDPFMLDLARSTQSLYYPELLADPALPRRFVRRDGVAESFGTLRYGQLFEGWLFDCRRFLANARDPATGNGESWFVPPEAERWLAQRAARSPCAHLAQMPSTPVLWTAGKWGEWYPDIQDESGALRSDLDKPWWPKGWNDQHDRLLAALSRRPDRTPLSLSGDLHATAVGRIHASRGRALGERPVLSVLPGAVGTGALGWPSKVRGQAPVPSGTLDAEELVAPIEENGFSLVDFTPETLTLSLFRWSPDDGAEAIDALEPFEVLTLPRGG